ncbi:MAG: hypothetical protein QNJ55_26980 [Xenococcus sp. MO_188.B8]|nr:hypothetical protein [Xenococcus sp. MO_188.B8]
MGKEKRLTISEGLEVRGTANSGLGQVISYLQRIPVNNLSAARATLVSRYLPFALDPNDPDYRATALRCAIECESWARAIREYSGLASASTVVGSDNLVPSVTSVSSVTPIPVISDSDAVGANHLPATDSDEVLLNKFEQSLQAIVDRASGAPEALDNLLKLSPQREQDWTESQWDLWDKYSNQQQDIVDGQALGDLAKAD